MWKETRIYQADFPSWPTDIIMDKNSITRGTREQFWSMMFYYYSKGQMVRESSIIVSTLTLCKRFETDHLKTNSFLLWLLLC